MTGEDGVSIIHPSYHDGEDGVSIIHPSYHDGEGCRGIIDPEDNIGGTAGPGGSTYLRSDNRFVFETPKDDSGISLHASANPHAGPEGFMKLGDIKGEFRQTLSVGGTAGPGGSTFMTDTDGRSIIHPNYNVGEDGRSIIHPNYNVGEDGRMIIHPQLNVGEDGRGIIHPNYNVGEDGRMIIHPQFNDGEETLPTGTIIPHEDSHLSAKDLIGQPPEPKIAPPSPHVSDRVAVIDDSNDRIEEVVRTSSAPRLEVFARMGR